MKNLRKVFAQTMLDVGLKDKRLVVLVGDISHGILKQFSEKCPDRYYNIGICEPSIVNLSAGLSKVGFIPVVHTIAPFLIERAYEQIKLDFGYQKLPINLISVGGSFDYSKLGCSHHCYSDISLLSHFKRSNLIIPGSENEFKILFKKVYKLNSINYFRLPNLSHDYSFKEKEISFGKSIKVKNGTDVTICVTGYHLKTVLEVQKELKFKKISVDVLYFHTLKPFDFKNVRKSLIKTKKLLCVEELSAHDGLYSLCLKSAVGIGDMKVEQIAINDFVHYYGSYQDLSKGLGLSKKNIYSKVLKLLKK